jgi:hypothetical protein
MIIDVAIVTPVLNDWVSFSRLLTEIACLRGVDDIRFHVIAVNDGSNTGFEPQHFPNWITGVVHTVEVLHLAVNLGHQRAIAVGLSTLARRNVIQTAIVMDCDGEDRPEDIVPLLAASMHHPGKTVLARRAQRSETVGFKIGYELYKAIFRLLTGRRINFGNFTVLPIAVIRRLVRMPDLWNNLPAAIMRSRLETIAMPLPRGKRFAGESRMNLAGLIVHGLSAMSVFSEIIFVRVLIAGLFAGGLLLVLLVGVVAVRFLTDLAIPGWATVAFGDLAILLAQLPVTLVATIFVVLSSRTHRPIIPFIDAPSFFVEHEKVHPRFVPVLEAV